MKGEAKPGKDVYGIMEHDLFPDLMVTFMRIIKIYVQKGFLIENFEEDDIVTQFPGAKKLLLAGIRMICDLTPPPIVESAMELAFIMETHGTNLSARDTCELYLAKAFILLLIENTDQVLLYQWIYLYCSRSTLSNVMLPMQYFDPEVLRQERILAAEKGGLGLGVSIKIRNDGEEDRSEDT